MGWTSYSTIYCTLKKDGSVDRKAECDKYFIGGLNEGHYRIVKSAMVGSTYYAAVQTLKKYVGTDVNGKSVYEDIPENDIETFAYVILTSVKDGEFYYKEMSEDMGPYESKCPKSIIKVLSPTDSEYANAWRQRCLAAKAKPNYPIGTIIEFKRGDETVRLVKCAASYQFKTPFWKFCGKNMYFRKKDIPWDSVVVVNE